MTHLSASVNSPVRTVLSNLENSLCSKQVSLCCFPPMRVRCQLPLPQRPSDSDRCVTVESSGKWAVRPCSCPALRAPSCSGTWPTAGPSPPPHTRLGPAAPAQRQGREPAGGESWARPADLMSAGALRCQHGTEGLETQTAPREATTKPLGPGTQVVPRMSNESPYVSTTAVPNSW